MILKRITWKSIFGAIFLCFPALSAAAPAPFKVGFITDMTGKGGDWAPSSRLGALGAVREFNAQHESACEVIFEDHQIDSARAISAAQKLLLIDKVDAIYSEFSVPSIAIAPLVSSRAKLHVYAAGARSVRDSYPHAFKSFLNYEDGCQRLAEHFHKQGLTPVGMLVPETEFGELCLQGAKRSGAVLVETTYTSGTAHEVQILSLKSKGAKSIIDVGINPDLLRSLKSMRDIRFDVPVGAAVELFSTAVRRDFPEVVSRAVAFGFFPKKFQASADSKIQEEIALPEAFSVAFAHVSQLCAAGLACPDRSVECLHENFSKSPSMTITGFNGWEDRIANFGQTLRVWQDGGPVAIP
jgi:ABC-type branched-subunit amino acid transport system substrate-binding protein